MLIPKYPAVYMQLRCDNINAAWNINIKGKRVSIRYPSIQGIPLDESDTSKHILLRSLMGISRRHHYPEIITKFQLTPIFKFKAKDGSEPNVQLYLLMWEPIDRPLT